VAADDLEISVPKVLSASGIVGDSGQPQILYGYTIKSGATAGVLSIKNGTLATSSNVISTTGTISQEVLFTFPQGTALQNGLYASFDTNVTSATIFYRQYLTA
jgi:hypothetical protein